MTETSHIRSAPPVLAVLAVLALGACSDDEPQRDVDGNVTEPAVAADVSHIQEGDCVGDAGDADAVATIDIVPCDEDHDQEAFAVFEMTDGDFPGMDELQAQAEQECATRFETFVGVAWSESELDVTWLQPTEESWEGGDREVVCLVIDPAGPVTGSLQDANR